METQDMPSKWERLKEHLRNKERFELLLLDLFRNWEVSQDEYTKMLKDRQAAYMKFLSDLKSSNEQSQEWNLW